MVGELERIAITARHIQPYRTCYISAGCCSFFARSLAISHMAYGPDISIWMVMRHEQLTWIFSSISRPWSPRSILWRISSMITSRFRPLTNVLHGNAIRNARIWGNDFQHTQTSAREISPRTHDLTDSNVPSGPPRLICSDSPVPSYSIRSNTL